jgi:hypothetical protein
MGFWLVSYWSSFLWDVQSCLLRADVVGYGKVEGWGVGNVVLGGVLVVRARVFGGGG